MEENESQDAAAGEEVCKEQKGNKYIARSKKVASRLPRKFISDSIADMRRRCLRVEEAKSGQFQEGGLYSFLVP